MLPKQDARGRFVKGDGTQQRRQSRGPEPEWRWSIGVAPSHALSLRKLLHERPELEHVTDAAITKARSLVGDVMFVGLCRRARAYVAYHDPAWLARCDRGAFDQPAPGAWNKETPNGNL